MQNGTNLMGLFYIRNQILIRLSISRAMVCDNWLIFISFHQISFCIINNKLCNNFLLDTESNLLVNWLIPLWFGRLKIDNSRLPRKQIYERMRAAKGGGGWGGGEKQWCWYRSIGGPNVVAVVVYSMCEVEVARCRCSSFFPSFFCLFWPITSSTCISVIRRWLQLQVYHSIDIQPMTTLLDTSNQSAIVVSLSSKSIV